MRSRLAWLLILVGVTAARVEATDLYVATNGNNGAHNSWLTAYTNVQDALNAAVDDDTIYLAGHTFRPPAELTWQAKSISVLGGYAATNDSALPGARDIDTHQTTLKRSGTADHRVLYIEGATNALLEGVGVSDGYVLENYGGGGIRADSCSNLTIASCTVVSNTTFVDGNNQGNIYGGGILLQASYATLTNCTLYANLVRSKVASTISHVYGGGLAVLDGSVDVSECLFRENFMMSARNAYGAGAYFNGGSHQVENTVFAANYGYKSSGGTSYNRGDGLNVDGASTVVELRNSLVAGNYRDGIHLQNGTLSVLNSTIVGHGRYGIRQVAGTVAVTNSILDCNADDVDGTVSLDHCFVGDGTDSGSNGNITGDPLFVRGLYLDPSSTCIGNGTGSSASWALDSRTTQTNGTADASTVDMGYHFRIGADASVADAYATFNPSVAELYVAPGGADGDPGTQAQPFRSITRALEAASAGSHIHIAAGSYTNGVETFPLEVKMPGIQLLGVDAATTVINAAGAQARLLELFASVGDSRIQGLTLTGATIPKTAPLVVLYPYDLDNFSTRGGAGLQIVNSSVLISACIVSNNTVTGGVNDGPRGAGLNAIFSCGTITNTLIVDNELDGIQSNSGGGTGAGGLLYGGAWTVIDSTIAGNTAGFGNYGGNAGGGLYMNGTGHLLRNVTIRGNQAAGRSTAVRRGGGLYMVSGTVEDCLIVSNDMTATTSTTADGGGVYMQGGLLRNSLVTGCTSIQNGGGIYVSGGTIESVTVAGNVSTEAGTIAGAYLAGSPTVTNSIFYGNERSFDSADASVSDSGGTLGFSCTTPARAGTGNTSLSPEFANAAAGNFQLQAGSSAIDAGTNQTSWMAGRTDLAGKDRIRNSVVDMGAYESAPPDEGPLTANFTATPTEGIDSLQAVFTAQLTGSNLNDLVYGWDFYNDGSFDLTGSGLGTVTNTYGPGLHSVRLVVSNAVSETDTAVREDYISVVPLKIYVSTNGNNTVATNWATAYTNIQSAINVASSSNTIYVKGDVFKMGEGLTWGSHEGMTIRGGYEGIGTPGSHDPAQWPTIIEYIGTDDRVINAIDLTDCTLEGVTITGGRVVIPGGVLGEGDGGAGILITSCSNLTIASCVVISNTLPGLNANINANGPGIYAVDSFGTITNTLIAENSSSGTKSNTGTGQGGGVMLRRGGWTIVGCTISNNTCALGYNQGNRGGGLYMDGAAHVVRNSTIRENQVGGKSTTVRQGGGVYIVSGTVEDCLIVSNDMTTTSSGTAYGGGVRMEGGLLRNSLVTGCTSIQDGGGIYASGGMLENVTVAGNVSVEGGTIAGAFLTGSPTVTNCIFYNNERALDSADASVSASGGLLGFSCTTPARTGTNNTALDPQFQDPGAGDYRLQAGSPAIDTGTNQTWMTGGRTDLEGNDRIRNTIVDMGAYEAAAPGEGPLTANFIATPTEGIDSLQAVFTAEVIGSNTNGLSYSWDFYNDGSFDMVGEGLGTVTNTYGPGVYSVRLVVENDGAETDTVIREDYIVVVPSEIYVSLAGDGSTGESWGTAFTNIQTALDFANTSNTVYLAGETFEIGEALGWGSHNRVTIRGGYEGSGMPGNNDPEQWPTIINYTGSSDRVMNVSALSDCTLEQVTITGGNIPADAGKGVGGGLRLQSADLDIVSCVFSNNQANAVGNGYVWGGAIYAVDSDLTVSDSLFQNNRARSTPSSNNNRSHGGAVASESTAVTIERCRFFDNEANAQGHHGSRGGAVYISGGTGTVRTCLMVGNKAGILRARGVGGAVYVNDGTVIENCTVVSNSVRNDGTAPIPGGGIYQAGGGVTNTIIYYNVNTETDVETNLFVTTESAFGYCCSPELTDGVNGNITADPLFNDIGAGDYTLQPKSPCRNAGINFPWMDDATDLAGNKRKLDSTVDIGAFEFVPPPGTMIILR